MSDDAASAVPKQLASFAFKPGQSGNPAGRQKGSRNRLADAFTTDLLDDWKEHGKTALIECRQADPATYVRVVASLLPKQTEQLPPLHDIPDERLEQLLAGVTAWLQSHVGGGAADETGSDPALPVLAVH